jgi:hypothetical protein
MRMNSCCCSFFLLSFFFIMMSCLVQGAPKFSFSSQPATDLQPIINPPCPHQDMEW